MISRRMFVRTALAAVALAVVTQSPVWAQNTQGGNNGVQAGVFVDAEGVLKAQTVQVGPELSKKLAAAAKASLNKDVAAKSELRKVSLTRLEKAVEAKIAAGQPITDEMKYLAGLKRIQYVFFYPETGDVVVAGPAEAWFIDPAGRVLSTETLQPTLHLEDLVTALRAYPPGKKGAGMIGCSIDPTQEGLQRMQQFLAKIGRNLTSPSQSTFIANGLKTSLGMQTITVQGVPGATHFAQVLVEADYRMKLIGIGLEQAPVKIEVYVDNVNPAQVAANAMQRWWFTPDYNAVKVNEDHSAIELVGRGVKLVGEEELVAATGARQQTGGTSKASKMFTESFTNKYAELAARAPVYGELRNVIDLAIVAAHIQKEDYYGKADWKLTTLGDERLYEVETHNVPAKVESAVNAIFKRTMLMTPIGGGVEIHARNALKSENLQQDADGSLTKAKESVKPQVGAGQWWWD